MDNFIFDFNDFKQVEVIFMGLNYYYDILTYNAEVLGEEYMEENGAKIRILTDMIIEIEKRYGLLRGKPL